MSDDRPNRSDDQPDRSLDEPVDVGGHPRGTLAIVGIYGLLFVIGWLIMYFGVFVPRGPLTE
ncbi:MAG: hypothetical protein OXE73_15500 [Gammaproteobacteria bacterium]|nr:hypothetical protein [Gammaproteobacteria bacterium]